MVAIKAHFDGKALVPDEPLDLPIGKRVVLRVEYDSLDFTPNSVALLRFAGTLDPQAADEMMRTIEEGCEKVEPAGW